MRGDVNQFDGAEPLRHFQRDAVGIDTIGFAVAVETERRHDRNDALIQQGLQQLDIHTLDLPREKMINALDDAHRVRDDGVGAGGAQVVGGKALEDFMRQPVRARQRQLQRVGVSHSRAFEIGRLDLEFFGQRLDLRRGAVDERDADVQRAEDGDVEQDIGEVFVGDDGAVDADDEDFFAKARDVLEDAAQVSRFHVEVFSNASVLSVSDRTTDKYSVFGGIQLQFSEPR